MRQLLTLVFTKLIFGKTYNFRNSYTSTFHPLLRYGGSIDMSMRFSNLKTDHLQNANSSMICYTEYLVFKKLILFQSFLSDIL